MSEYQRRILLRMSNTLLIKFRVVTPYSGISSVALMDSILETLLALELFAKPEDDNAYIDLP